jgi:sodium/hydrogen antiporter
MLLNISIFAWYGAVAPWADFRTNDVIPLWRLIFLGVLILLLRRVPMVMLFWRHLKEIEDWQQALFVGFFGPIGVSAVFYLFVSIDFLEQIKVDGVVREDAARLSEVIRIVVWFLAISSIVVHGLSVPLGKFGYHMPRQISQALSSENEQPTGPLRRFQDSNLSLNLRRRKDRAPPTPTAFVLGERNQEEPSRPVNIIEDSDNEQTAEARPHQGNTAHLHPLAEVTSHGSASRKAE